MPKSSSTHFRQFQTTFNLLDASITRKPSIEVALTRSVTLNFLSYGSKLWPSLTFEFDVDSVKMNQHAIYLGKKVISFKRYCPDTH